MSRRSFLPTAIAAPLVLRAGTRDTDIAIEDITFGYEDYLYRTPLKFGGTVVDRVTLLNVNCVIKTRSGKTAKGFGSMPLGNVWSFPSKTMPYDRTLGAMKQLSTKIAAITRSCGEFGHPIDINTLLEPKYLEAAALYFERSSARSTHPEALHAGHCQPFRRRRTRRLWQAARPQFVTRPTDPT